MKKILKIILIITMCFLPKVVSADLLPLSIEYEAKVTNEAGATYYSGDAEIGNLKEIGMFKFEAVVNIVGYESEFCNFGYSTIRIDNKNYYIKNDDVAPLMDTYLPIEADKLDQDIIVTVLTDDVFLYQGPATGLNKSAEIIAKDTKLTLTHQYKKGDKSPWYYTEYNGVKGWVNTLNGNIGFDYIDSKEYYYPYKENQLYDQATGSMLSYKEKKVLTTIPYMNKVEIKYDTDIFTDSFYVVYNEFSGFVNIRDLLLKTPTSYTTKTELTISDYQGGEEIGLIPANTIINSEYAMTSDGYLYINYDGKQGWINTFLDNENTQINTPYNKEESKDLFPFTVKDIVTYGSIVVGIIIIVVILINIFKKEDKNLKEFCKPDKDNEPKE